VYFGGIKKKSQLKEDRREARKTGPLPRKRDIALMVSRYIRAMVLYPV
jgi:hypothetical protein